MFRLNQELSLRYPTAEVGSYNSVNTIKWLNTSDQTEVTYTITLPELTR